MNPFPLITITGNDFPQTRDLAAGLIYAPYMPIFTSPTIDVVRQLKGRDYMLGERTNGRTFKILIEEILTALHKNKEEHIKILEESQKGFRVAVIADLDKALREAKEGIRYKTQFSHEMPRSHTREFDNAIDLLGALQRSGETTIDLTADEYERFVRNNWSWSGQFIRGSSAYSATAERLVEKAEY